MAVEDLRNARLQEHKQQLEQLKQSKDQLSAQVKKAKQAYNDALRTGDDNAKKAASDYISRLQAAAKELDATYNESAATYDANNNAQQSNAVINKAKEVNNYVKTMLNNNNSNNANRQPLSRAFFDGLATATTGVGGNVNDAKAQKAMSTATNLQNASAVHGAEAAQHQQIANRNEFGEAGKIASVQNDAQNRQTINNQSFAAGTAAARLRQTNAPDVQSQIARQDQQRTQAEQLRMQSLNDQTAADMNRADANQFRIASRDYYRDKEDSENMSQGNTGTSVNVNYNGDNTSNQNTTSQKANQPEQQTAEQTDQTAEQPAQLSEEDEQLIANTAATDNSGSYLTFANVKTALGLANDPSALDYMKLYKWLNAHPDYKAGDNTKAYLSLALTNARAKDGQFDNRMKIEDIDTGLVPSDCRLKNILSDERMKITKQWYEDGLLDENDFEFLAKHQGGKFTHNGKDYDYFDENDWENESDVLRGYADFITNYLYTYKPEATQIDPSIDPNEQHIGPMAQDIEKVNPACVKETPEGVKEVDTNRLAMMNAGVIGDLARRLQALEEAIYERK